MIARILFVFTLHFIIQAPLYAIGSFEDPQNIKSNQSTNMCRHKHFYDSQTNECVYCANGTEFDKPTKTCSGYPSPFGKCYGDDHYHAATKQCMYCATGYSFNEKTRLCGQSHR